MRIALVTSSYAPHIGGVEEHVRNVANVLRDRGHDVCIWTIARDGSAGVRSVDGIEVRDLPAPLPARSLRDVLRFLWRLPPAVWVWWRAARSAKPDLLHVHCFGPNGTYARFLSKLLRLPLILSSHGETLADDDNVFVRSRLVQQSLRGALAEANAVTGCSLVTLQDLESRFGLEQGRGEVVANGIDLEEPIGSPPPGATGPYVAAVGRAQRMKGFDLLIDAFARADIPHEVRLVIGGGGPELPALRRQADELGIGDRVTLSGWLDRPSMGALRQGALAGVVPSRFEAFGIAVLEVWRSGVPLVATLRGGPPEFVGDGRDGILVDPEDPDAFALALSRVISDTGLAERLSAAGTERVRDFTWDHTVDDYEPIYRRVTS